MCPPYATRAAPGNAGSGPQNLDLRDGSRDSNASSRAECQAQINIANVRRIAGKGSLIGAFDLTLPSGLIIKGVMLHEIRGKRWVGLPAQGYIKADGSQGWAPLLDFATPERRAAFQRAVLPLAEAAFERANLQEEV
jgi:hypothetical protein